MPCKNSTRHLIIAIDGPAGSGKSTIAKEIAKRFGILYIDTGAMYRALTLAALKAKIDLNNHDALVELAKRVNIRLEMSGDKMLVLLDEQDVSRSIREQSLSEKESFVARVAGVRREMVKLQRRLAKGEKGAVLEGRDIGTVVFPKAKYKFYLDAHVDERARRRFKELKQMGQKVEEKQILRDISIRDESDMAREVAPLVKADDAIYIDTTKLSVKEVAEKISARCSI